ncbi:unnamed protein product [marine sediment metagenome]|uniref:Uncharacterized protein n=1 Tax=marine sediment metagenome TaxID=412755 RepID=X1MF30_9ZZZZ
MNWFQILGPTLLMLIGGILSWLIKSRSEELKATEKRLLEERRKVYLEIVDPYISLFCDPTGKGKQEALRKITSYKYRKSAFELNFFGSDKVVFAYNSLLQYAYKVDQESELSSRIFLPIFGKFLLEIRKSLGNKKSKLSDVDMLRSMIKNIDEEIKKGD